jgi:hypothetical protein
MAESEHPEPDGELEKLPRRPSRDTEKALGLEVAKLFGLSPRLLVAPVSPPADPEATNDQAARSSKPGGSRANHGVDPEPTDR